MEIKFQNGTHLKKGLFLTYFSHILVTREKTQKFIQHISHVHLAKLIPRRFKKPAVCKYPITVIESERDILLPKPYSLMWYFVCGNRVRNCRDRRPQTRRMRSPKVALLTFSMDSVQYNAEHCRINVDTDGW